MQDERPIDLASLGGDLPARDLVRPAVRRFRLHVVLFTVIGLIASAAGALSISQTVLSNRERERMIDSLLPTQFYEAPMVNQREAWFTVDGLDIGVVQVRPLADGRLSFRILLIATEASRLGGECCTLVTDPASESDAVTGLRGDVLTPGEMMIPTRLKDIMIALPAAASRTFEVHVVEIGTGDEVGSFTVDLADLRVDEDL